MKNGEGLLLDMLFSLSKRDSLSELKYEKCKKDTIALILNINPSDYTVEQWAYALSYITRKDVRFSSRIELVNYLRKVQQTFDW